MTRLAGASDRHAGIARLNGSVGGIDKLDARSLELDAAVRDLGSIINCAAKS
jgi:hypothetical protein